MRNTRKTIAGIALLLGMTGCASENTLTGKRENTQYGMPIVNLYKAYPENSFKKDSIIPLEVDRKILREQGYKK